MKNDRRPIGVTLLSGFFLFGTVMSLIAFVSLLFPGSFLEPLWRFNPRAHEGLSRIGVWAVILMGMICAACFLAAVGLFRGARLGYWLAIALLSINLLGDVANVVSGTEPRAAFGIPIAAGLIAYLLSRRVRNFFSEPAGLPV